MIPFRTTAPSDGSAVMTMSLIAANVAIYFIQIGFDGQAAKVFIYTYALVPGVFTHPDAALQAGLDPTNLLPFVSNTFMHGGALHLIFNMWTLWLFGVPVESALGKWRFLLFYLAAGLAGSIGHMVFNLDSMIPALGASGAIAGVLGGFAILHPKARVLVAQPIFFFPLVFPLPAYLYTLIWFGLQAWGGFSEIGASSNSGGIAWWAHIGGFVVGVGLIFFIQKKRGRTTPHGPWG